jgi:peptide deformylase
MYKIFPENAETEEMYIRVYPDPILRLKSDLVTDFSEENLKVFCRHLALFCKGNRALGLSAPQVGVSRRIFVINQDIQAKILYDDPANKKYVITRPLLFINPVIKNAVDESTYKEGCMSFPGIYGNVKRFNSFDLEYQDIGGITHIEHVYDTSNDLFGTIVQHEIDHLDGILFIDKLSSYDKDKVIKKINKLRKK